MMKMAYTLTQKEFNEVDRILNGIAWKYNSWYGLTHDDIYQHLWEKSMVLINDCQKIEPRLIAKNAYNRVSDLIRYTKRRRAECHWNPSEFDWKLNYESDDELASNSEKSNRGEINDSGFSNSLANFSDFDGNIVVSEILTIFPSDSKEALYLKLVAAYVELGEESIEFDYEESMQNEIAKKMGYAHADSNGYRRVRNRVRDRIHEYLKGE